MYELPTSISIDGESFQIRDNGDFRMILHCFEVLNAEDMNERERVISCLRLFYEDFTDIDKFLQYDNLEEFVIKMFDFMNCGKQEDTKVKQHKLIDWDKDSMLVISAINNVAGKEVRAEKWVHWWTFMAYYMAIGECPLSTIVSIRHKLATGKKLEDYEKKFRLENPQYFNIDYRTVEEKQADDYVRNLWNGGDN